MNTSTGAPIASPLRIIKVIDTLAIGGAERVFVDVANLLAANGYAVTVVTLTSPGELSSELHPHVRKVNMGRKHKFNPFIAREFIKLINEYDIVHIHMRHILKYFYYTTFFRKLKAAVVFHDHYGDIGIDPVVPFWMMRALKKAVYVGVSSELYDWALANLRMPPDHVFCLPNIVLMEMIPARRSLNEYPRFIAISNFRKTKNIEFLLEVAAGIREHTAFKFDIYGNVSDKIYFQSLVQRIEELNLGEHVSLVHACKNAREKIPEYDLAIHGAKSETGPLVIIEYMASYLPFVTFSTGEVVKQISPFFPEFIMQEFSVTEWVRRIMDLWSKDRVTWKTKFEEVFGKFYSPAGYLTRCREIYDKALK